MKSFIKRKSSENSFSYMHCSGFALARSCKCHCPVSRTPNVTGWPFPARLIVAKLCRFCILPLCQDKANSTSSPSPSKAGKEDLGHQSLLPQKTSGSHRKPLQPSFLWLEIRGVITHFDWLNWVHHTKDQVKHILSGFLCFFLVFKAGKNNPVGKKQTMWWVFSTITSRRV